MWQDILLYFFLSFFSRLLLKCQWNVKEANQSKCLRESSLTNDKKNKIISSPLFFTILTLQKPENISVSVSMSFQISTVVMVAWFIVINIFFGCLYLQEVGKEKFAYLSWIKESERSGKTISELVNSTPSSKFLKAHDCLKQQFPFIRIHLKICFEKRSIYFIILRLQPFRLLGFLFKSSSDTFNTNPLPSLKCLRQKHSISLIYEKDFLL